MHDAEYTEGQSTATRRERRGALTDWLHRERDGAPYTTAQIVDVSGIYDGMQGRWDKCHSDLKALRKNGVVESVGNRPARWEHSFGEGGSVDA